MRIVVYWVTSCVFFPTSKYEKYNIEFQSTEDLESPRMLRKYYYKIEDSKIPDGFITIRKRQG